MHAHNITYTNATLRLILMQSTDRINPRRFAAVVQPRLVKTQSEPSFVRI